MPRWNLHDEVTGDDWLMQVGPKEGVEPATTNPLGFMNTSAEDGEPVYYGTQAAPMEINWAGQIISLDERAKFREWSRKPYPVILTTDLDDRYRIRWTEWTPTRKKVASRPYRADYTAKATVITIIPPD